MQYRHLSEDGVDQWVKGLLARKGDARQLDFLEHVVADSSVDFVRYVERSIAQGYESAYGSEGEVPSLLDESGRPVIEMTAGHMYLMDGKDIVRLYQHWEDIPYTEAACPTLWGSITLSEINAGRIRPVWLAVDRGSEEARAREEIGNAVKGGGNAKKIDRLVRRCLRWMMGPGHMRGAAELYSNCSLAKAWWCGHMAQECQKQTGAPVEELADSLKSMWLGLADYFPGKLRVISEPNVIAGIALWGQGQKNGPPSRQQAEEVCLELGRLSSWRVLGLMESAAVASMIGAAMGSETTN